jgi:NO-binding membrane sensor protein with MHYT domain
VPELVLAAATVAAVIALAIALPPLFRSVGETGARSRLTPSLVILTGGALITFTAWLAFDIRCGESCVADPAPGLFDLDSWWRRRRSWQWEAQLLVVAVALPVAALAFALEARRSRRARLPLGIARALYGVWIVAVFGFTAVSELVT